MPYLADDLPAIQADRAQIQQIIMNLITNASDALGDHVGLITITTSVEQQTSGSMRDLYHTDDLQGGLYVVLEICDDGCGLTEEVKARLFDPFFTTKETGRGLGMSAVQGIVHAHSGAIHIYSEPGEGSCFKLLFPAISESALASRPTRTETRWKGSGCVLVVDDESSVRSVAKRVLESLGFSCLTATNGREALDVYEQRSDEIVLVLLDMMMPIMSGKDTLRAMRRLNPGVPIIMSSGFNEQEAINRLSCRGMTSFLQKPYRPSDMERAVREVLNDNPKSCPE